MQCNGIIMGHNVTHLQTDGHSLLEDVFGKEKIWPKKCKKYFQYWLNYYAICDLRPSLWVHNGQCKHSANKEQTIVVKKLSQVTISCKKVFRRQWVKFNAYENSFRRILSLPLSLLFFLDGRPSFHTFDRHVKHDNLNLSWFSKQETNEEILVTCCPRRDQP